jgi:hypothetical protein
MSFSWGCARAALVVGLSGLGCSSVSDYQAPPPCKGNHCGAGAVGGGVVPPDGGGTGGAGGSIAGASDVAGTVHRISTSTFDDVGTVLTGAATVFALPGTAMISAPYGGSATTTFTLPSVPAGLTWFLVRDETNGGSGVLSTFSQATVPSLSALPLPALDLGVLQNIASSLPMLSGAGVSTQASQIILLLTHGNGPYKGVSVSGGSVGATVVYDLGPGNFTDTGTATGSGGMIILFNSGISGPATIALTDNTTTPATQYALPVRSEHGAATIVRADLE